LGRYLGIPTRVVTGYLASNELQTRSHKRGLAELAKHIPKLLEFPPEQLYLVTTSHRHSWTQFYLPPYGWIDFETTSFAIPPPPGFDPNAKDVVIPLIQNYRAPEDVFVFPWILMAKIVGVLAVLCLAGFYIFKFGKLLFLAVKSRENTRQGAAALYRLALMNMAAGGLAVKKPSQTPLEYAEVVPECADFSRVYTELVYRINIPKETVDRLFNNFRSLYKCVRGLRKPGIFNLLRKPFSFRGLYL